MGWFRRRREEEKVNAVTAMATAFSQALGSVLSAQSSQIEQNTKFIGVIQDLSAKQVMRVMGQKGGQTTQRRKKLRREADRAAQSCVLCTDPMHRGTTLEQIAFHRQHEDRPQLSAESQPEQGN